MATRTPSKVDVSIKIKMDASDFGLLSRRLEEVTKDNAVFRAVLRRSMASTFLSAIRQRFLGNLRKALEMDVLFENGKRASDGPRQRMNDMKSRERLSKLYASLTEAEMQGDKEKAQQLRSKSIPKAKRQLIQSLGKSASGQDIKPHRLSAIRGTTVMRRMALKILEEMQFVESFGLVGDGLTLGIGNLNQLEQYETPSATSALTGQPTKSRYKVLWRHLEFGTGLYRKDAWNIAGNRTGNPGPYGPGRWGTPDGQRQGLNIRSGAPRRAWFYGKDLRNGLLLGGTEPMNFLLNRDGKPYDDWEKFQEQFAKELERVLSI